MNDMNEQPNQPVYVTAAAQPLWKDLLVPAAIVLAGVAVGLGLFLSGNGGAPAGQAGAAVAAVSVEDRVIELAEEAGVDEDPLVECLDSGRTKALVQSDVDNAVETGGRGTPWSIAIGPTGKTYPINGALPQAALDQLITTIRAEGELPAEMITEDMNTDAVAPVTDADYIKGDRNAAIKIVEYSDFDCPFCARFHTSMAQVVAQNSDIAWVYRHFPLDQLHPSARFVAEAAECVGELGGEEAFWSFTDAYYKG